MIKHVKWVIKNAIFGMPNSIVNKLIYSIDVIPSKPEDMSCT